MPKPKPEYAVSVNGIRAHLSDKVEEWLHRVEEGHLGFPSLEAAEQAFKDWLWGTSHE